MKKFKKFFEDQFEYDDNGNLIHYKDLRIEYWKEYNENGKIIHYKDSKGNEKWYDNGNLTLHRKIDDGVLIDFDKNGNIIHGIRYDGTEYWKERDENGKVIHYNDSTGLELSEEEYCQDLTIDEWMHIKGIKENNNG